MLVGLCSAQAKQTQPLILIFMEPIKAVTKRTEDPHLPNAPLGELTADIDSDTNKAFLSLSSKLLEKGFAGAINGYAAKLSLGEIRDVFREYGVRFSKITYE